MSLTSDVARSAFTLTGSGQTLAVPFYILASNEVSVWSTNSATLVDTLLAEDTDYQVTGAGNPSGFSVIMTAGATGDVITVARNGPLTQQTVFAPTGALPTKTIETLLDRLTMLVQQLQLAVARSLRVVTTSAAQAALGLTARAGFLIGFDAAGNVALYPNPYVAGGATAVFLFNSITGTTGGGATNLDGLDASALAIGTTVQFTLGGIGAGPAVQFQLTTSAAATSPQVIAALNNAGARWIQVL